MNHPWWLGAGVPRRGRGGGPSWGRGSEAPATEGTARHVMALEKTSESRVETNLVEVIGVASDVEDAKFAETRRHLDVHDLSRDGGAEGLARDVDDGRPNVD